MKKKVLLSSVLTIALCLCLIAGSTFALFTSQSNFNISVTAGNVKVEAGLTEPVLMSAEPVVVADGDDTRDLVQDENGKYYRLVPQQSGKFANEGTAQIVDGMLVLDKITPGDRVEFEVTVANTSDVEILKRLVVECVSGFALMNGLEITVGEGTNPMVALDTYTSAWAKVDANATIDNIKVAVELPVDAGNEYQGLTSVINFKVEAVQGNANIEGDVETITYLETVTDEATLAAALADGGNVVIAEDIAISGIYTISEDTTISVLADLDASACAKRPFEVENANLTIEAAKNANIKVGDYGLVKIASGDCDVTLTNGNYFGETYKGSFIKPLSSGEVNITLNNVNYTDIPRPDPKDNVVRGWIIDGSSYAGTAMTVTVVGGTYVSDTGFDTLINTELKVDGVTLKVKTIGFNIETGSKGVIENSTIVVDGGEYLGTTPNSCVAVANPTESGNAVKLEVNNCTLTSDWYVFGIYSGATSTIVANDCDIALAEDANVGAQVVYANDTQNAVAGNVVINP